MTREVRAVLARARALLVSPDGWVKGKSAATVNGDSVGAFHAGAVRFCLTGACARAAADVFPLNTVLASSLAHVAIDELAAVLRARHPSFGECTGTWEEAVQRWNDRTARTHGDVLELLEHVTGLEVLP